MATTTAFTFILDTFTFLPLFLYGRFLQLWIDKNWSHPEDAKPSIRPSAPIRHRRGVWHEIYIIKDTQWAGLCLGPLPPIAAPTLHNSNATTPKPHPPTLEGAPKVTRGDEGSRRRGRKLRVATFRGEESAPSEAFRSTSRPFSGAYFHPVRIRP